MRDWDDFLCAKPEEVCFFSGAGISADLPTGGPLGDALTESVVRWACGDDQWDEIRRYYAAADLRDSAGRVKSCPRLEVVLGHISAAQERDDTPLHILANAKPNGLHRFFAAHLHLGGGHITVNLDRAIEHALNKIDTVDWPVVHLHGEIDSVGPLDLRGLRVADLGAGLGREASRQLVRRLEHFHWLCFVGYSGRDYFDVDPFFREQSAAGRLPKGLTPVWIGHAKGKPVVVDWNTAVDCRAVMQPFHDSSVAPVCVTGETRTALNQLAAQWGLGIDKPPVHTGLKAASPVPKAASWMQHERWLSQAQLWVPTGIGPPLIAIVTKASQSKEPHAAAVREAMLHHYATALDHVGRYADAAKALSDEPDRMSRAYRIATSEAQAGYLWRAFLHHSTAQFVALREARTDQLVTDARVQYLLWYLRASSRPFMKLALRVFFATLHFVDRLHPRPQIRAIDPRSVMHAVHADDIYIDQHPHALDQLSRLEDRLPELSNAGPRIERLRLRYEASADVYAETDSFAGYAVAERDRGASRPDRARAISESLRLSKLIGAIPAVLAAKLAAQKWGPERLAFPRQQVRQVQWSHSRRLDYRARWVLQSITRAFAK